MDYHEPSLWDNIALEMGCSSLGELMFDEALNQFNKALQFPLEKRDFILANIAACEYWQSRIKFPKDLLSLNLQDRQQYMSDFLKDYLSYPFVPGMTEFKKSLLAHLADHIKDAPGIDFNSIESIFDLLLGLGDFLKAKNFILGIYQNTPGNYSLLYLVAQAQWFSGSKGEANKSYGLALLYHPSTELAARIENSQLKQLVVSHGAAISPAFAWIQGILPKLPLENEIPILGKEHLRAVESYKLLQQAQFALKNQDWASCIDNRKQLKEKSLTLYEAYFEVLKSKKL